MVRKGRSLAGRQVAPLAMSEQGTFYSARISYLEARVLATAVHRLQIGRVDDGEDVAHVVVGIDGVQPFKGGRRPHLHRLLPDGQPGRQSGRMAYIDDGIPAAGEQQAPIIGEIQTQDALLVRPDGEHEFIRL